jgi:hypothetical protein
MPRLAHLTAAQSDPTLREEGVWVELPVAGADEPLKLKLRALASTKARAWDLARFRKQRAWYLNDGTPPIAVIDQNEADKLAEVLIVEWNITNDDGTALECTAEKVREVMLALPDTRREALAAAGRQENYRLQTVEALGKNSSRPSKRTSATGAAAA